MKYCTRTWKTKYTKSVCYMLSESVNVVLDQYNCIKQGVQINNINHTLIYTLCKVLRGCLETLNSSQIYQGIAYCFNENLNLTH
jgi:hypothetical protein